MPFPWEAVVPFGVMLAAFGVTGAGMSFITWAQHGGKPPRWSVDQWDRQMMERDRRLTGWLRGQTDKPTAPPGFELSNRWKMEKRYF